MAKFNAFSSFALFAEILASLTPPGAVKATVEAEKGSTLKVGLRFPGAPDGASEAQIHSYRTVIVENITRFYGIEPDLSGYCVAWRVFGATIELEIGYRDLRVTDLTPPTPEVAE